MAAYRRVDGLKVTCRLTACIPGSAPGPTLGNRDSTPFDFGPRQLRNGAGDLSCTILGDNCTFYQSNGIILVLDVRRHDLTLDFTGISLKYYITPSNVSKN